MGLLGRRRTSGPTPPPSGAQADGAARLRTIRARVSGRVQGVGFRWYCTEQAQQLGLVGRVSNLSDGDVEVLAQGPADAVSQLVAWLYHGPRWARVDDVRIVEMEPGSLLWRDFRPGN